MSKLYELAKDYSQLVAEVEEYDLDPDTLLDTLNGSSEMIAIEEKAENIVKMIKNFEADLPGIDAEIKRLTDRKKAIETRTKSVKTYLQGCMEIANIEKLNIGTFKVSLQNNPAALTIHSTEKIPAEFMTIVPEQHIPDKSAIKKAMKDGLEIEGLELTQGRSLRIR